MKIAELQNILVACDIPSSEYSLSEAIGQTGEVNMCLWQIGNNFTFFIWERAEKYGFKTFSDEDESCHYFLANLAGIFPKLKKYVN